MDRLNRSYLAGIRSVDKAIELGIAIKSLFAPKRLSDNIAYTIRKRATKFLDGSNEERCKTEKFMKDDYNYALSQCLQSILHK